MTLPLVMHVLLMIRAMSLASLSGYTYWTNVSTRFISISLAMICQNVGGAELPWDSTLPTSVSGSVLYQRRDFYF